MENIKVDKFDKKETNTDVGILIRKLKPKLLDPSSIDEDTP